MQEGRLRQQHISSHSHGGRIAETEDVLTVPTETLQEPTLLALRRRKTMENEHMSVDKGSVRASACDL